MKSQNKLNPTHDKNKGRGESTDLSFMTMQLSYIVVKTNSMEIIWQQLNHIQKKKKKHIHGQLDVQEENQKPSGFLRTNTQTPEVSFHN